MGITPQDVKKIFADIIAPEMLCRQVRINIESASIICTLKQLCTSQVSQVLQGSNYCDIYIIMCPSIMS